MAIGRWTRRAAWAVAVSPLVLAVVVAGVVRFGWGREPMRQFVEREATGVMNGTVHLGAVSGSLLNGVTFRDVRFVHAGEETIVATSIDVRFSLWRWLRGGREITSIRLVDPVIRLRERDQEWDAATWVKARSGGRGSSTSITIPSIEIVNGRLLFTAVERVWRLPRELGAVNALVAVTTGDAVRLEIQRLSFVTASPGVPDFRVKNVTGALRLKDGAGLERIRVESDAGTISVTGTVGATAPRVLTLDAALDRVDTAAWRRFTSLLDTVALTASGSLKFSGPVDRLTIDSALTTSAGRMSGRTLIENAGAQLRITGDAQLVHADMQGATADPLWKSDMTGRAQFEAISRGTPSAWAATVTLTGGPFHAFGADLDTVDGRLHYEKDRLEFTTAATAYGAEAHGRGVFTFRPALTIDVSGDRIAGLDPRRLPATWHFIPLEASLAATDFAVHWTDGHWTVRAALDRSTLEGATFLAGTTVEIASDPGVLRVAAAGDVRELDARRMGHATGLSGLDDPIFVTTVNGHFTMRGQGADLANIDLTAEAALQESRAAVGATIHHATLTYTRRAHLNTAHIVGAIAHLNPTPLGASPALASDINGDADLTAVWRDDVPDVAGTMTATGTLRAGPSTISELPVTSATVTGEWRDGRFRIDQSTVQNRGVRATASGWMAVSRGASTVKFDVTAIDVGALEPWTGRKATGVVAGSGTIDGAFDAPHIVATYKGATLADPILGAFTNASGTVDILIPEWYLDRLRGDIAFDAASWTSADGSRADQVTSRNHFTSRMTVDKTVATALVSGISVGATLSADWTAETTATITALTLSRGQQRWQLEPASRRLVVSTSHLDAAAASLTNGRQRLEFDGRAAWSQLEGAGDAADHLTIRATDLSLTGLDEFLQLGLGGAGQMSGVLSLDGRLSDPRGRLTVNGKDLDVRGYRIADVVGTFDLASGAATTSLAIRQPDGLSLTAVGRVPLSAVLSAGMLDPDVPSPTWDFTAVSDPINLDIFSAAMPQFDGIGGQAIADIHITGPAGTPDLSGTLAIADGRFNVPSAGIAFSNVFADVGLGTETITVRRFTAKDKRQHVLSATGQFAMNERQLGHVDVHLETDRVLVLDNAIGAIELSTLLELKGDVANPKLTGNVEVVSGRVEVDRLLRVLQGDVKALVSETDLPDEGTTLVHLKADAEAAATAESAGRASSIDALSKSFLSGLAVDVRILAPDNLILRGNRLRPNGKNSWSLGDLNVTVGADLQAERAPGGDARFRGDVTMVRGSYTFESRRFDIQRGGRIQFRGETPINPGLDVRGVRTIDGVEARVDVRGSLSEPRLQLGSSLPLEDADILSMIIFNHPANQLGETQRADLVGAAASLAGGFVASPLTQSLTRALNLDLLEVETVSFGQSVAPRIRIGQRLTDRIFVQLSQQFGTQTLTELSLEYQLTKFLRLQAGTAQGPGSRGQGSLFQRPERVGLDLLFFFNF